MIPVPLTIITTVTLASERTTIAGSAAVDVALAAVLEAVVACRLLAQAGVADPGQTIAIDAAHLARQAWVASPAAVDVGLVGVHHLVCTVHRGTHPTAADVADAVFAAATGLTQLALLVAATAAVNVAFHAALPAVIAGRCYTDLLVRMAAQPTSAVGVGSAGLTDLAARCTEPATVDVRFLVVLSSVEAAGSVADVEIGGTEWGRGATITVL